MIIWLIIITCNTSAYTFYIVVKKSKRASKFDLTTWFFKTKSQYSNNWIKFKCFRATAKKIGIWKSFGCSKEDRCGSRRSKIYSRPECRKAWLSSTIRKTDLSLYWIHEEFRNVLIARKQLFLLQPVCYQYLIFISVKMLGMLIIVIDNSFNYCFFWKSIYFLLLMFYSTWSARIFSFSGKKRGTDASATTIVRLRASRRRNRSKDFPSRSGIGSRTCSELCCLIEIRSQKLWCATNNNFNNAFDWTDILIWSITNAFWF